jgi:hypothetical protein
MSIVLPTLAVAIASFCVWLGLRIFNRRERWAKWTLASVVCLPMLYVLTFGPVCLLCERGVVPQRAAWIAFRPLTWLCAHGPDPLGNFIRHYAESCGDQRRVEPDAKKAGFGGSIRLCFRLSDGSKSPIDYEFIDAEDRI